MAQDQKWRVHGCENPEDLARLYRFRYAEYVEKKGLFRDTADHDLRQLSDPIDSFGVNFIAEAAGEAIGSIRLNGFDQLVQKFCVTEFDIAQVSPEIFAKGCVVTRAMVRADWRSSPVFMDLALTAAKRMRDDGKRWMFVDTATSRKAGEEERFRSLYTSMGFQVWRESAQVPGIGPGAVMLFDLERALADPKSLARLYLGGA